MDKISERQMHYVRWLLTIGWLILIFSMFYDPISMHLTDPNSSHMVVSPFQIKKELGCVQFQDACAHTEPYTMGARFFWGIILPIVIFVLLVLGHEAWRRMCPLMFLSQIPRALGWQRRRRIVDPLTKVVRSEPVTIAKDSWLGRNSLYVQFGLLFLGLNVRLLFVNSDCLALGIFLCLTIFTAITVGFLYAGKSWCHYFCPMAPVQTIYTGPRGLFASQAHQRQEVGITQSMCRTVDKSGHEKSACVSCQSPCFDIDAEKSYWEGITRSDRKLLYYGYVGLVIGFYFYFTLYSGNPNFLAGGVWGETNQFAMLFKPGFYFLGQAIPIPKLIAVPLTLTVSTLITYAIGRRLERAYKRYIKRHKANLNASQIQHQAFTICAFISFNLLFWMGVNPTLAWLPAFEQQFLGWIAVITSTLWFYRTFRRSSQMYARESLANSLRRQLSRLTFDFTKVLEGRSIQDLKPDEVYVLAKTLPELTHEKRVQMYKDVLQESLTTGNINSSSSLELLELMRDQLEINDEEHHQLLREIGIDDLQLLSLERQLTQEYELRLSKYRKSLELILRELIVSDLPLKKSLQFKEEQILAFRQEYNITDEEESEVLAHICDRGSLLDNMASETIQRFQFLAKSAKILREANNLPTDLISLISFNLQHKQQLLVTQLLRILEIFGDSPAAYHLAIDLALIIRENLAMDVLEDRLYDRTESSHWQTRLHPKTLEILKSVFEVAEIRMPPYSQESVCDVLMQLIEEADILLRTASLYALKIIEPSQAIVKARQVLNEQNLNNTLLSEEAQMLVVEKNTLLESSSVPVLDTFEKMLLLFRNILFRDLKTETLANLAREAEIRIYNLDEELYKEGDYPHEILSLVSGSVQIGSGEINCTITQGQTIGELEIITQTTFRKPVIVSSPQTLILAIADEVFLQVLREDSLYTRSLLLNVSTCLQEMLIQR